MSRASFKRLDEENLRLPRESSNKILPISKLSFTRPVKHEKNLEVEDSVSIEDEEATPYVVKQDEELKNNVREYEN